MPISAPLQTDATLGQGKAGAPACLRALLGRVALIKKCALGLLPLALAAILVLSFPPYDLGFLAWFTLPPLFYLLRNSRPFFGAGLMFVFGVCLGMGSCLWIGGISAINAGNVVLMVLIFSVYYVIFGGLYWFTSLHMRAWMIIVAPALWVAFEYIRANFFFLSWPWFLLGHSQYRYLPIIQLVDITGVYGVSFVIAMVGQVLSELPELPVLGRMGLPVVPPVLYPSRTLKIHLVTASLAVALVFSYGLRQMTVPASDQHLRVALVQANVLARQGMSQHEQQEHMNAYHQLTRQAAKDQPDLIVWPSSSLPAPINASKVVKNTIEQLASETGTYLVVGGAGYDKVKPRKDRFLPYSNSEFLISPAGRIEGQYNKIRLLPFNEYPPLSGVITWPKWITTVKESFVPGETYSLFQVAEARFGTPICWENLFADFFRQFVLNGANLMLSVTNEGFFGPTGGPHQTLAMNVFRAVENRVAVVRVATTGVSAFINANGQILDKVRDSGEKDLFVAGFLVRDVPLFNHKTFYTQYGDAFAFASIAIAGLSILASLARHLQSKSSS